MARRRNKRAREAKENGPELIWILAGLGVLGAGAVVYVATRPKAAAATTTQLTPAQQAFIQNSMTGAENNLLAEATPVPIGDTIPDAVARALAAGGGGSNGPVNTGNSQIDNAANSAIANASDTANNAAGQASDAVNSAASQLGF